MYNEFYIKAYGQANSKSLDEWPSMNILKVGGVDWPVRESRSVPNLKSLQRVAWKAT